MGLLSYLQDDPLKQEALRRGLLGAGFAMMQSQNPKFLGVLGQGGAVGVPTYLDYLAKMKAANAAYSQPTYKTIKEAVPAQYRYKLGDWSYSTDSQGNPIDLQYMKEQSDINKMYNENELEKARRLANQPQANPLLDTSAMNIKQLSGDMPIFPIYGEEAIGKMVPGTGFPTGILKDDEYAPSLMNAYQGSLPNVMLKVPSAESINQGSIVHRTKTSEELASELEAYSRSLNRQTSIPYQSNNVSDQSQQSQVDGISRQQEVPAIYGGPQNLPQMPIPDMKTRLQINPIGEKKIVPGVSAPYPTNASRGLQSTDIGNILQPSQLQYGSVGIPEGISQRVMEAGAPQMPTDIKGEVVQAASPAQVEKTPGKWSWEKYIEAIAKDPMHPNHEWALKWYLEQAKSAGTGNINKVNPSIYTPESLATFAQTGNYKDLKFASSQVLGKANTSMFTPESMATYSQTGNPADLVPLRTPIKINTGNEELIIEPFSGTILSRHQVQPKPEQMPSFKGDVKKAEKDAEIAAARPKEMAEAKEQLNTLEDFADSMLADINELVGPEKGNKKHKGFAGAVGNIQGQPGVRTVMGILDQDVADAAALIDAFKSKSSIENMAGIRRKIEGSIGQITEKEWPRLESAIAALATTQSEKQFEDQLRKVQRLLIDIKARARIGYLDKFGDVNENESPPDIRSIGR